MAGNILEKFGSSGQTITCSIASLTNNSARQSTVIDNSSNLYIDALVFIQIASPSASTSASGFVEVFAYGTVNGGTTYTEGCSGTDGSLTMVSPTNLRPLGIVNVVANSTTYYGGPFSVAQAFGGILPEKWGIVLRNSTGGTLNSTEGNHAKLYQGVYAQYT